MHRVRGLVCGSVKRSIIKGFAGLTLAIGGQICWQWQGISLLGIFESFIKFKSLIDGDLYSA
jgi:hypothetical protein